MNSTTTCVHWFRKGLRLHDNPALIDAIKSSTTTKSCLRPIFILDPLIIKWLRVSPNRWRFLQQTLVDLNENLKKINSRLYIIRGNPEDVFKRIFKEWNVNYLSFESDIEPYSKKRDITIEDLAKAFNVKVVQCISHTIYNPEIIIKRNFGKPPLTYQKFLSLTESLGKVSQCVDTPNKITFCTPQSDSLETKDNACYDPPTLQELGVNVDDLGPNLYPGGETEALSRMHKYTSQKSWICKFEKPNTSPNSLAPSTTVLSPYLKFGCLSPKLFYHKLKEAIGTSSHSKPPVSLIGQLMWREFYYCAASSTINFDKMIGNPICYQIPWTENNDFFLAWKYGKTGYPFIDAIMRQLRLEGWIHHLARHAVACFLTRGDLWISWERGQEVFEEWLLDSDWALNAGNWMWLSASAFFHQFFRVYSPVAFGKKTDGLGLYVKKYVPELEKYPAEYIYEPWKAPKGVQMVAGCVVGVDYPNRIVVHEVHKVNIKRMSEAYKKNKEMREAREKGAGEVKVVSQKKKEREKKKESEEKKESEKKKDSEKKKENEKKKESEKKEGCVKERGEGTPGKSGVNLTEKRREETERKFGCLVEEEEKRKKRKSEAGQQYITKFFRKK